MHYNFFSRSSPPTTALQYLTFAPYATTQWTHAVIMLQPARLPLQQQPQQRSQRPLLLYQLSYTLPESPVSSKVTSPTATSATAISPSMFTSETLLRMMCLDQLNANLISAGQKKTNKYHTPERARDASGGQIRAPPDPSLEKPPCIQRNLSRVRNVTPAGFPRRRRLLLQ